MTQRGTFSSLKKWRYQALQSKASLEDVVIACCSQVSNLPLTIHGTWTRANASLAPPNSLFTANVETDHMLENIPGRCRVRNFERDVRVNPSAAALPLICERECVSGPPAVMSIHPHHSLRALSGRVRLGKHRGSRPRLLFSPRRQQLQSHLFFAGQMNAPCLARLIYRPQLVPSYCSKAPTEAPSWSRSSTIC